MLYVILIANIGPSMLNIVVAVVMASAPGIARIVRGLVLTLMHLDFVAAAHLRRESGLFIMLVELLPNCRGPLITDFCLRLGYTTITIGTLGFLGLGLPPPDPDWGSMVKEATVDDHGAPAHVAVSGHRHRHAWCWASTCWPTG